MKELVSNCARQNGRVFYVESESNNTSLAVSYHESPPSQSVAGLGNDIAGREAVIQD
jgi:hypothetical protein